MMLLNLQLSNLNHLHDSCTFPPALHGHTDADFCPKVYRE